MDKWHLRDIQQLLVGLCFNVIGIYFYRHFAFGNNGLDWH